VWEISLRGWGPGHEGDIHRRRALVLVIVRIQQLTVDRAMFAPIWNVRALMGVGSRVADHAINPVPMSLFPSYEDMKLRERR
jgi:peptide/nickel transport system substrate-binding protein